MDADIVQISAGAVSDIIGIGMIVIAATTIIETGGATQTLLAAGITLVAGGTLAMTISSADIVKAQKEYSTTLTNLVGLELEVAVFDTVYNQLTASERLFSLPLIPLSCWSTDGRPLLIATSKR
jgi:hypothetical protein